METIGQKLADLSKISRDVINKHELNEITNIPLNNLKAISKALGVSISYLVDEDINFEESKK